MRGNARLAVHAGSCSLFTGSPRWVAGLQEDNPRLKQEWRRGAAVQGGAGRCRRLHLPSFAGHRFRAKPSPRGLSQQRNLNGRPGLASEESVLLRSAPRLCPNQECLVLTRLLRSIFSPTLT